MKLLNGFKCQYSKILMCTTIYIKYFFGPINYTTVSPGAIYQGTSEEFPCSLNNCTEMETRLSRDPFTRAVDPGRSWALLHPRLPLRGRRRHSIYKLMLLVTFVTKTHLLSVQPSHRNAYCS